MNIYIEFDFVDMYSIMYLFQIKIKVKIVVSVIKYYMFVGPLICLTNCERVKLKS